MISGDRSGVVKVWSTEGAHENSCLSTIEMSSGAVFSLVANPNNLFVGTHSVTHYYYEEAVDAPF